MEQTQSIYGPYVFEISSLYETACELTTNSSPMQHDYLQVIVCILLKKLNGLLNCTTTSNLSLFFN